MKTNVGMTDRVIRLVLAAVCILLFGQNVVTGIPGIILVVLALFLTIVAIIGFCPLYTLFGINTHKKKEEES